jgi:CPA2 family monovalent cation:H+ antiporter-2
LEAETQLLFDVTLMLIVAGICSIMLKKLKLPTIIGYLAAGFLLGPHIFPQVVVHDSTVTIFSSLGIVLLMFYIGLELNLRGLRKVASYAAIIVVIEMSVMIVIGYALGMGLGLSVAQALFLGVTISCASTAVVLGTIKENDHMKGNLTKAVTGILVMEDIGLIIVLALTDPVIGASSSTPVMMTLLIIVIFIALSVVLGLAIMPRFMDWVDQNYSGETLFIVAVGFGFGMALTSSFIGLSEAIGAFLAGIIVSQSLCSSTICHRVEPMKEMFMAVFFLSIGLQLDPTLMLNGLPLAMIIAAVFIGGKLLGVSIGCFAANFKSRSGFLIASSMVAMGEFTFVVAKVALDGQVIGTDLYSSVIGAAVITMLLLPFISRSSPKIFDAVVARLPKKLFRALDKVENMRLDVRRKMSASKEERAVVRKEVYKIFVDFVIIVTILLVVGMLSFVKSAATSVSSGNSMLADLILMIVALIMIVPALIHLIKRLQVIAITFAKTVDGDGVRGTAVQAKNYKLFMNFWSVVVFITLMVIIYPLLPSVEGLPIPPGEVMIGVFVVAWMSWENISSRYEKLSARLMKSITDSGGDEEDKEAK